MDKLPGVSGLPDSVKSKVNDGEIKRMVAIIGSMTQKERRHPDLLNGSRRARVAKGSGTQPADVNRLLKQYMQMEKMMSKLSRGGGKGLLRQMSGALKGMGGMGGMGGLPPR
jgi:signal recognition particle subunit SRP54